MTQKVDVQALAQLARLDVTEEELAKLEKEIPAILGFVETIQHVSGSVSAAAPSHRNIMREDTGAHEPGIHTEELLSAAPGRRGDRIAVKQVLHKKK